MIFSYHDLLYLQLSAQTIEKGCCSPFLRFCNSLFPQTPIPFQKKRVSFCSRWSQKGRIEELYCSDSRGTAILVTQRLNRRQRKSRNAVKFAKSPVATIAVLRSEGVPGEYHPPDAEAWRNSSPSFARKGGRGRRIATHYHQASRNNASQPKETIPP